MDYPAHTGTAIVLSDEMYTKLKTIPVLKYA